MNKNLQSLINKAAWINRLALFIVYFWFGLLKITGTSPAEGLVTKLFNETIDGYISLETFLPSFGVFECILGILWIFPVLTRWAFWVMCLHMVATFLPMILLKGDTWQSFLTLTLTGQYIIKNVVLIASSWFVYSLHANTTAVEISQTQREYVNAAT